MKIIRPFGTAFIILMTSILVAKASDCDKALIQDSIRISTKNSYEWKAAVLIDEKQHTELQKQLGANAVVYGIPLGANYKEFTDNINNKKQQSMDSLNTSDARDIAISLLSDNSAQAFEQCIEAQLNQYGVQLAVRHATPTTAVILLKYTKTTGGEDTARLAWSGKNLPNSLPNKIISGGGYVPISIDRNKKSDVVITVNRMIGNAVVGGSYARVSRASIFKTDPPPACQPAPPEEWVKKEWSNVGAGEIANWVNQTCAPADSSGIRGGVEMKGPYYNYSIYIFCRKDKGRLPPSPYIWQLDRAASMEITPNDKTKVLIGKVLGRENDTVIGLQQIPRP